LKLLRPVCSAGIAGISLDPESTPRFQLSVSGKNILGADKPVSSTYTPSTGVYGKNYADPATVLASIRFSY